MKPAALPILALIDALRAYAAGRDARPVTEGLAALAARMDLAGLRLELTDAGPLPPLGAGYGTLAGGAHGPPAEVRSSDGATLGQVWTDGDAATSETAATAVITAVQAAQAHLRAERAEEHLAALDAALRGMSGPQTLDHVLQLIVDRVRELATAEYAALGITGDDGAISQFLTSGIDAEARRRIGALPRGHGLLGLLIGEGRTIRVADVTEDPRRYGFPPHHPAMHAFLGVPIKVRDRSIGNLYLANKRGAAEFSASDQELVERFARHAGLAIENARLAEQVRQLLVIEERERIGADLHDGVIQRIYGVNLSLDDVAELVGSDPAEAARRVEQAITALNDTIREIRDFIYILRPPGDGPGGLLPSLHALAAEVRMQWGLGVEVTADDEPRLAPAEVRELVRVAREALSNAARHAGAGRVDLSVRTDAEVLTLEVSDDGRGFDAAAVLDQTHRGLANMRRRVERLGGTLQVASRPGSGTRIVVTLAGSGQPGDSEEDPA